ncbi:hypothetical protein SO802_013397 [Lithocarpus litseifolius]|uniref:Uncharacterized protein n=1 Tax=Lithocarpus litseifolius TaxID=425828 RepID=A0AAW2D9K7_9ROSI
MWKDCIKLKRLKERPKISAQQAAEKQKPKQTTEIRLRGSRAQDGILKFYASALAIHVYESSRHKDIILTFSPNDISIY